MLFTSSAAAAKPKKEERKKERLEKDEKYELQESVFMKWANVVLPNESPKESRELGDPALVARVISRITGANIEGGSRYEFFQAIIASLGECGAKLTPADLADNNQKAILQLWWSVIHIYWRRMAPEPQKNEKVSEAIRVWCTDVCSDYPQVSVNDFTSSWRDGHAFNVLLHHFDKKLVSLDEIAEKPALERLECAFKVAEKLGVPKLLEAKDLHSEYLDSRSVVVYLMSLYLTLTGVQQQRHLPQQVSLVEEELPCTASSQQQIVSQLSEEHMLQPSTSAEEPTTDTTIHLPILPEPVVMQTVLLPSDPTKLIRQSTMPEQGSSAPSQQSESVRSRKSSSSSQKSSRSKKKKDELAKEFDACLEQVLAWLLEAEEECAVLSDVETDDISAVKTQFRDYEQFMASLTDSQDTVGRVLHRGQILCQKAESDAERDTIQKQLELVNTRWEALRMLAMERQAVLQTALTVLQQQQLSEMAAWIEETEHIIEQAGPIANTRKLALEQIASHTALQKRIADFEPTIARLSSFMAVVDESENEGDMSVQQLETMLKNVGQKWEYICSWAETRAANLDGLAQLITTADQVFAKLNDWLSEREAELMQLKSAHHLTSEQQVAEQVKLLQNAEAALELEHDSFVKASQLSCELVARLDTSNGAAASDARKRLDSLTQRWDNIVTRIEEHSKTLVKSGKADLKETEESAVKVAAPQIPTEPAASAASLADDGGDGACKIVQRFLLHVEKVAREMKPLHEWCSAFSLSKKPSEAKRMIAICQEKLLEIKEQEAKVNHLQLEMEQIHMNKELDSRQLKTANDTFADFAKDWAEIVTKISEALNVLSGHPEADEEAIVAQCIESWIASCDEVLCELQKASVSERAVRARKLKEQWDVQNANLAAVQKDQLKRAILSKGLQLIGKRLQQHIAFEAEKLATSSVMMTSTVQNERQRANAALEERTESEHTTSDSTETSKDGTELARQVEEQLYGAWHTVGSESLLREDLQKIENILELCKAHNLPVDLIEGAETRKAETVERLQLTTRAAEKYEEAKSIFEGLFARNSDISDSSSHDFYLIIQQLAQLREELAQREAARKESDKLMEKMLAADPDVPAQVADSWHQQASQLAHNWTSLADSIEHTITCAKREQKRHIQETIDDSERVLQSLSKTLDDSESAGDAEQLSEHLDQIESLLEQVPADTSKLESAVVALDEEFVRDSWQRHSASRQQIAERAKQRIQQIADKVHLCERFDALAADVNRWAPGFSAVLAARKGADISALDIPVEYKRHLENGALLSVMQDEFARQSASVEEMRQIAQQSGGANDRFGEQLQHTEKVLANISACFAEFKQPVNFEKKLDACADKLRATEQALSELSGIKIPAIDAAHLEATSAMKDLAKLTEDLCELDAGKEQLLRDGFLSSLDASNVKDKIHNLKKKAKELQVRADDTADRLDDCKVLAEKLMSETTSLDQTLETMERQLEEYGHSEFPTDAAAIEGMVNAWNRNEAALGSIEELERALRAKAIDVDVNVGSRERCRRAQELKARLDAWNVTAREMSEDHESLLLEVDEMHAELLRQLEDVEKEQDPKEISLRLRFLRHDRDRLSSRARRLAFLNPRLSDADMISDVHKKWSLLESRLESNTGSELPELPDPQPPYESFSEGVELLDKSFKDAVRHLDFEEYPVHNAHEWCERLQRAYDWMAARREALAKVVTEGRRLANTGRMELDIHDAIEKLDNVIDAANEFELEVERSRADSDVAAEKTDSLEKDIASMLNTIRCLKERNLSEPEILQATRKDLSARDQQLCSLSRRAAELHASLPGRSSAQRDTILDTLNQELSALEIQIAGQSQTERSIDEPIRRRSLAAAQCSPDRTSKSSLGNSLAMEVVVTDPGDATTEDEKFEAEDADIVATISPHIISKSSSSVETIRPIELEAELLSLEVQDEDIHISVIENEAIPAVEIPVEIDRQSLTESESLSKYETPPNTWHHSSDESSSTTNERCETTPALELKPNSSIHESAADLDSEDSPTATQSEIIQKEAEPQEIEVVVEDSAAESSSAPGIIEVHVEHIPRSEHPVSDTQQMLLSQSALSKAESFRADAPVETPERREEHQELTSPPTPTSPTRKGALPSMDEVFEILDAIEDSLSFQEEYPLEDVENADKQHKSMSKELDIASKALDASLMELNMVQAEHTRDRIETLRKDLNDRRKRSHDEKKEWIDFMKAVGETERIFEKCKKLTEDFEKRFAPGDRTCSRAKEQLEKIRKTADKVEQAVCNVVRSVGGLLPRMREGGVRETDTRKRVFKLDAEFSEWNRKTRALVENAAVDVESLKTQIEQLEKWCSRTEEDLNYELHWIDIDGIEAQSDKLASRLFELVHHRNTMSHVEALKDRLILLLNIDPDVKHDIRRSVSNIAQKLADIRSDASDAMRSLEEMKLKAEDVWQEVGKVEHLAEQIEQRVGAIKGAIIYTPSCENAISIKNDAAELRLAATKFEQILAKAEHEKPAMPANYKKRMATVIAILRNAASSADGVNVTASSSALASSEMSLSTVIEVSERSEVPAAPAAARADSMASGEGTVEAMSERVESLHDEVHTSEEESVEQRRVVSLAVPLPPEHGQLAARDREALQTLTQIALWLGEAERDGGAAVDLADQLRIREQANVLQTIVEQIKQRAFEPVNVADASASQLVKHRAADLCANMERVSNACQNRRSQLLKMLEHARTLEGQRVALELWMTKTEEDIGDRPPIECADEAVRFELSQLEASLGALPEQKARVHEINARGNAMLDEFARDEGHSLSHILSRLNMRWTTFNDNIRIRRAALEASLRSRSDFHSALADLEDWTVRIQAGLQKLWERTNNAQSLKDTQRRREWMQTEKNFGHEIDAHAQVVKSVEEMGQKIVAGLDEGQEKQILDSRLAEVASRWHAVNRMTAEIKSRLSDAEQEWEKLTNSLTELMHWTESKSQMLLAQQPVGGCLSAVLSQGAVVKNLEREMEARNVTVKEVIASAHSYLMQHDLRPKMYRPGLLDDSEELIDTSQSMEERRFGLQIHANCEKLKEKWTELSMQCTDWAKVIAAAALRLQELERALAECQLHLSSIEQELESARAVENLRLEELKAAREDVEAMTERVDQLRVHLDDANDACGRILAADMSLDAHPKNQLEAVNERFHAVKTAVRVRTAALRNALSDFGPSSEHFLNQSVTLPWQRAVSKTNQLPYYIDHNTEHTQWEHPVWVEMAKELASFNRVKFIAYRCAMKLRALQKRLCLDLVSLSMLEKAFARLGRLSNEECPQLEGMVCSLLPLFETLHQQHPQLVKSVALAVDLCINFLLNLYDPSRDGVLRVLSFKVALIVFCNAPLEDKYRALFELVSQNEQVDQKHMALLFYDLIHIPRLVGEAAAFGGTNVEPSVRSCFETVRLGTHVQLPPFLDWLKKEPQSIVWLPVMHRLATAEFSKHQAKCNVCKMFPIVGLRYRCLHCFNFDMCQNCFFSQRTSKNHKLKHPMQEYSVPTTSGEDMRDFAHMLRNKFGRRRKTIGYLPVEVGDEGRPLAVNAPPAHNATTSAVHSRIAVCAQRIGQLTQHEPVEQREEMVSSDVKSPLQLISQVEQMQKDELDQLLQRLQLENLELKHELEKKRQAVQSTPDLDRSGYGGTVPRQRDATTRGETLPRLGGSHSHGRSVPSLNTARSINDIVVADEARALRLHKQRLEHRSRILEQQNTQLEMQLQRLKKMIEQQQQESTSSPRLPSLSAERDWLQSTASPQTYGGAQADLAHSANLSGSHSQPGGGDSDADSNDAAARGADRMHSLLATVDDLGRAMESLVVSVVCDAEPER